jgi:hypothetical protein
MITVRYQMANPKWQKGQSGNPKGRPKTAFKENFDQLAAKKRMFEEATQVLSERWVDVCHAMCDQAELGNTQAAAFMASYVLGKPKETIIHDVTDEAKEGLRLAYKIGD